MGFMELTRGKKLPYKGIAWFFYNLFVLTKWFRLMIKQTLIFLMVLVGFSSAAFAKPYKGAEIFSIDTTLYGKFVFSIKAAKASGVISTFFTYKDGSEQPGIFWEEIDVEIFGKDNAMTWQSNVITGFDPRQLSEAVHDSDDSLSDSFHTFAVEWRPDSITWLVDDIEVRSETGSQVESLTNPQSMRFNFWPPTIVAWVGQFDASVLPLYMFVDWFEYHSWDENSQDFSLEWRDDFDTFDSSRWGKANWTFDVNAADFDPNNANVENGNLVLSLTQENPGSSSSSSATGSGSSSSVASGGNSGSSGGGSINALFIVFLAACLVMFRIKKRKS
jgi:beta-glucanase (GH16 family)